MEAAKPVCCNRGYSSGSVGTWLLDEIVRERKITVEIRERRTVNMVNVTYLISQFSVSV